MVRIIQVMIKELNERKKEKSKGYTLKEVREEGVIGNIEKDVVLNSLGNLILLISIEINNIT